MAKVTPGNKLYFYQLFATEIGVGKQVRISRIEEVLEAADVLLEDVECETVDELVAELNEFIKLTVFKGGRRFVTVFVNEDLDLMLQRGAELAAEKKAAAAAGKAWRHGRASKVPRPAKPRHRRPKKLAPQPVATEASPTAAQPQAPAAAVDEASDAVETPAVDAPTDSVDAAPESVPDATPEDAPAPMEPAPDASNADQDETPSDAEDGTDDRGRPALSTTEPTDDASESPTTSERDAEPAAADEPAGPVTKPASAPSPTQEQPPQDDRAHDAHADDEAPGILTVAEERSAPISLTITYDPSAESAAPATPPKDEPRPEPEASPKDQDADAERVQPVRSPRRPAQVISWPESISQEVFCPDSSLLAIFQALPPTIGILDALDEGFELARQAGTIEGTRTRFTYPLSRRIEGNPPIEVTVRRDAHLPAGKHWRLEQVDTGVE